MSRTKRPLRPMKRERLSMDLPVTVYGREKAVRVRIGSRFLWMFGQFKGKEFRIPSEHICRWGAADGPKVTKEEKEQLMFILGKKSEPSPFMRLVFTERGRKICYDRTGNRKEPKKKTGRQMDFEPCHHSSDTADPFSGIRVIRL